MTRLLPSKVRLNYSGPTIENILFNLKILYIMRDLFLIIHFIGLAMGLGTSLAFMFLGMASAGMEKNEAVKFTMKTFYLSKMGNIGLTLLVISGVFLMTPYWENIGDNPLLILKLILVLVLGALIGIISATSRKVTETDSERHLNKIKILGGLSLLTALTIVVLAVLVFH